MGNKFFIILVLAVISLAGCSKEVEKPSGVSNLPPQPETPRGLTASIGDGQVVLDWVVKDTAALAWTVVYYSDSSPNALGIFDTTDQFTETVDGLVNGRRYFFRVSAIDTGGLEGFQSGAVAATPGIFSISIAGGQEYINTQEVSIALTAPTGVTLVQLSEDPLFADAHWLTYTSSKVFTLSNGDGLKTVYARFEIDAGGGSIEVISDDIILDRVAIIEDVKIFLNDTLELDTHTIVQSMDTLRCEIHAATDGQEASVNIDGLGTVSLNDLGNGADTLAGDGVYTGHYIIPDDTELRESAITARFKDLAGNQAPDVLLSFTLSATSPPPQVNLWGYQLSSLANQLLWSEPTMSDFSSYRVFRSVAPFTDSLLVTRIATKAETGYEDGGLDESTDYRYWVYVDDTHSNSTRSADLDLTTLANTPPDTLTIVANITVSGTSVQLSWPAAARAPDFKSYYAIRDIVSLPIYGDDTSYPIDLVLEFLNTKQTTSYLDANITDTGMYYYQVYVADLQGMVSRSNEVSVHITDTLVISK
jgi:hypothetical protein